MQCYTSRKQNSKLTETCNASLFSYIMKQQEYINLLKEEYGEYKCIMASLELENVEQT